MALAREAAAQAPTRNTPARASCVEVDTTAAVYWWPSENADSLRAIIDPLERRLAVAANAEVPALLLRLGRAKAAFRPSEAYGKAHPEEFFYNEIAGDWLYQGWHFRELMRRFPRSEFVDDAAYEVTKLSLGGECEGFTACYVGSGWHRVAQFLREYPQSPLADSAVARALVAFHILKPDMDLRRTSNTMEPQEILNLVATLDTIGRMLTPRVPLLARAGELWEQIGEYDRARSAYRMVMAARDVVTGACVAARMAALPAR